MAEETDRQRTADFLRRRKEESKDSKIYWLNIKSRIHHLNDYFLIQEQDVHQHGLDLELRSLWEDVIQAAKQAAAEDELSHYRLVSLVAGARAKGALLRPPKAPANTPSGSGAGEVFKTDDGVLWTDLPFFRPVLYDAWEAGCAEMGSEAWTNLNKFAALLTGVNAVNLLPLGLWTIKLALEEVQTAEDDPSVEQLLPAAVCWFRHASPILRTAISHRKARAWIREGIREDVASKACEIGLEARESEVLEEDISVSRWEFWKRRLLFLSKPKGINGEKEKAAEVALEAFDMLNSWPVGRVWG